MATILNCCTPGAILLDACIVEAEIYFMAIQNGLGRDQFIFQNQECVNILGCSVTFYEYKNVFLMLVD